MPALGKEQHQSHEDLMCLMQKAFDACLKTVKIEKQENNKQPTTVNISQEHSLKKFGKRRRSRAERLKERSNIT